jgi:acetolactate synthase-1/2/3 large subunit
MPAAADVVCRVLRQAGTGRTFVTAAAPGVLVDAVVRAGFDVVPADAGSAVLMAAVTGVLTDSPGLVVAGPDERDAAAALAHAVADRAPLIVLTGGGRACAGGVRSGESTSGGEDDAERPDIRTVAVEPASAAHQAAHACQVALRPPRAPVRLALGVEHATRPAVPVAVTPRPTPPPPPEPEALEEAARLVAEADRPAVVAGLGCRDATAAFWLRAFAEALPAPVVVTRAGRGALPDAHPLGLGRLGQDRATRVLERADLVVALGLDGLELAGSPLRAPVLAVGLGSEGLPGVRHAVAADIALVLEELAPRIKRRSRSDWDVAALDRLKRDGAPASAAGGPLGVARLAQVLSPPGVIGAREADERLATVDDGWESAAPLDLLGPAAPVEGFAPAAAVAAALAEPGRRALAFTTPEALRTAGEALALAGARRLNVGVVVFGATHVEATGVERAAAAGAAALVEALGRRGPSLTVVMPPV